MRRTALLFGMIAGLVVAGFYISTQTAYAAKKTAANLSASIPNAKSNFVDHESTCTADLAAQRAAQGNTRAAVSSSNPYKYDNWISLRNQPATTATSVYPAGTISVDLQFNQYMFLCGVVMSPASGGATSSSGNRVTNTQYPNDRNPVRASGSINRADLIQKDARVMSARVVSGGGSVTNMAGQTRNVQSPNDSRYSAGTTIPFKYTGNLNQTTTVRIEITVREVRSYYAAPSTGNATIICDSVDRNGNITGASGFSSVAQAFSSSRCNRDITRTYNIQIRVAPPSTWVLSLNSQNRVKPSGSSSFGGYGNYHEGTTAPRTVRPGDVVQWQHEIRNTGNATARFERWRDRKGLNTSSYILVGSHINATLGAGASVRYPLDSSNVTYTIKQADIGKTICERYVVRGRSNSNNNALGSTGSCVRVVTDWSVTGMTTMRVNGTTRTGSLATPTDVKAGDTINWTQTLRNNGPQPTHRSISVGTLVQDYNASNNALTNQSVLSAATVASGWASGATRTWQNGNAGNGYTYTIKASDVGKILCRRLQWDPTNWNDTNSALTYSTQRCVRVPYNFNLTPTITNPPRNAAPGEPLGPINPRVTNNVPGGGTTVTPSGIRWQLSRFELGRNVSKPANTTSGSDPCAYFGNGCVPRDSGTRSFPSGATVLNALNGETVPIDAELGSKICYGLSVQPYSNSSNDWRHYSVCIGVNKTPSVQILGGDLRVGGLIDASYFTGKKGTGSATFGSWVEYGALSRSSNDGLASGSGLVDGQNKTIAERNKLTFANRPAGTYGNYHFTVPYNMANQFNVTGSNYTSATFALTGKSGTYRPTGNVSISGAVDEGKTVVIYAPTRIVTITDNITYGGEPYTSRDQIPQLVIVARDIRIQQNVETVNAWLLASGYVDTCSDVGTAGVMPTTGVLSDAVCNKTLTVNGPVATDKLVLKRTAGAGAGSEAEAAEVFNLRADAYLWRYQSAANSNQVRVISVKELPPRF